MDASSLDEVEQRIWVKLSEKMVDFRYDPAGSFRAWLRRFCLHRSLDFLRENGRRPEVALDDVQLAGLVGPEAVGEGDDEADADRIWLLKRSSEIQERVRSRVKPKTWRAFWLIGVEETLIEKAAEELGMSYIAAYMAHHRVAKALRAEGCKLFDERSDEAD